MSNLLFSVLPVGALVSHAVVAVVAIVGTYLFLRNNPKKEAKIDAAVDKLKKHSGI